MKLRLSRSLYPKAALAAAALAVGERARALLETDARFFVVTLEPARGQKPEAVEGDFLNAALAFRAEQETRKLWGSLSRAAYSRLISEGFAAQPPDPLEQLEPVVREQRRADREAALREAAALRAK